MTEFFVNSNEGSEPQTSISLLERVRRNEQDAWERLVSLYTPLVCHWCTTAGLSHTDIEEVVQEVFLAVAKAMGAFHRDQQGDTFRGWLRTITANKINDQRAPLGGKGPGGTDAQRLLKQVASAYPPDTDVANAEAVEKNILYNRAVELIELAFEPKTRRAFWLLIAGQKAVDVAQQLQMTCGAVYNAKSRVLKRLRDEFLGLVDLPVSATE